MLDLLDQHGLDPGRLTVEVTETSLSADVNRAAESLLRLRAAGIGVAIDDFGTGHASLSYLANLPCDIVKIDRKFTAGIGVDDRCTAIVHGVISMAHELGLTVVAEGVETVYQRDQLLALNCQQGQGYLFGKAAPATGGPRFESRLSHPATRRRLVTPKKNSDHIRGQVVLDLANDLEHCADLLDAFECVMRALRPNVVFTGGSIQLIGPDGIRLAAAHPPPTPEALDARLPMGQGVGWSIVASGELRYIPDITELSASVPSTRRRRSVTRDTRSYLGVPLLVAGKAIGLFQIDSVDADAFADQEQLLTASCACILANAIAAMESRSEDPAPEAEASQAGSEFLRRR